MTGRASLSGGALTHGCNAQGEVFEFGFKVGFFVFPCHDSIVAAG